MIKTYTSLESKSDNKIFHNLTRYAISYPFALNLMCYSWEPASLLKVDFDYYKLGGQKSRVIILSAMQAIKRCFNFFQLHQDQKPSYRHKTSNYQQDGRLLGSRDLSSKFHKLESQDIQKIKTKFMRLLADKSSSWSDLGCGNQKVGIYGQDRESKSSLQKFRNCEFIGQDQCIRGISEANALRFSRILLLDYKEGELQSIIFKLPQKFTLQLRTQNDVMKFLKRWEQQILKHQNQFLLSWIYKFTAKVAYFQGSFWVTVNEPIFDIVTCFNWEELGKNIQNNEDLEVISYFLRCCYVKEFIMLIMKKRNASQGTVYHLFYDDSPRKKKEGRSSDSSPISPQNQVLLPKMPKLKRSLSESDLHIFQAKQLAKNQKFLFEHCN